MNSLQTFQETNNITTKVFEIFSDASSVMRMFQAVHFLSQAQTNYEQVNSLLDTTLRLKEIGAIQ